jgi:hypothetical protein
MTTEAPSEVVAVIARMDAIELRWRNHEGHRVLLAAIVKNNRALLDAATEKLRDQEVPEMKLASGIRQIRAGLMAAMHDLAEHDTQAADIKMEIDEICTELVRLREKYGPGII